MDGSHIGVEMYYCELMSSGVDGWMEVTLEWRCIIVN